MPIVPSERMPATVTLPQAVALYIGAVVGAGVLILRGVAATIAGPASILAWAFDSLLGIPLALTLPVSRQPIPTRAAWRRSLRRRSGEGWVPPSDGSTCSPQ
jgi:amino acid efflux transporter